MRTDYGTDNGPNCPRCSGTVYAYQVDRDPYYPGRIDVIVACVGCNRSFQMHAWDTTDGLRADLLRMEHETVAGAA